MWRQAGRTDYRADLQQVLENAGKQSAQVAEALRTAAQKGPNASDVVNRGLQGSRQGMEAVTEQLQAQLRGGDP